MDSRNKIVVAFLLVLGIIVTFQIMDPSIGERKVHKVNLSDPPSELVYDSIKQLRDVDYTYVVEQNRHNISVGTTESRKLIKNRVQNTKQRYLLLTFQSDFSERYVQYGNKLMGWKARDPPTGIDNIHEIDDWKTSPTPYKSEVDNPLSNLEKLKNTEFHINKENDSHITLATADTDQIMKVIEKTNFIGIGPNDAELTVTINKRQKRVEELFTKGSFSQGEVLSYNFTFKDYRQTKIERPQGIPYTFEELVKDLLE